MGFNALKNQSTKIKNLLSVSMVSVFSLVVSVICTVVYQIEVVNRYNYSHEPITYKIAKGIAWVYNAPLIPAANLVGRLFKQFMLPYGWLLTFIIPSLVMWITLEWKSAREKTSKKPVVSKKDDRVKPSFSDK